ncbi:hypothetical protein HW555_008693 [Spodoptera exigua]|uniref:Uncharacterized protein n=1 Tax=Spodoptera exigua TaxID=7107 RepID=A0A835GDT0_SPOEX|nr:hypothetical protein HW555_008693 [Spodoptera exigua]
MIRVDVACDDVTDVDVPSILVRDISAAASHTQTRQKPEIFDDIQRLLAIKTDLFVCRVLTGCAGSVRAHYAAILAFHPIPISIEEGARNSCERETQHFPNKGYFFKQFNCKRTPKRTVYVTEAGIHVLCTIVSPIKQ